MEDRLWELLYHLVGLRLHTHRGKRQQFSDAAVLLYLWSGGGAGRPVSWACRPGHAPRKWIGAVPSEATMSRRLRSASVRRLSRDLERELLELLEAAPVLLAWHILDAKPLVVGSYSKDRQARRGWGGPREGAGLQAPRPGGHGGPDRALDGLADEPVRAGGGPGPGGHGGGAGLRVDGQRSTAWELYRRCAGPGLQRAPQETGADLGHHEQHPDRLRAIAEATGREVYIEAERRRAGLSDAGPTPPAAVAQLGPNPASGATLGPSQAHPPSHAAPPD